MATEPKADALTRRPGATRSLVRGVGVKAREVHITGETVAMGSMVPLVGSAITMFIGAGFEANAVPFAQQGPAEIGAEVMGAVIAGWVGYGTYRGGKAAVKGIASARRNLVEAGRADIARSTASRTLGE